MRSMFIVATCALAIFAAPLPEVESIWKPNSRSVARGYKSSTEQDAQPNARSPAPFGRGSHPRSLEDDEYEITLEARSPTLARPKGSRSSERSGVKARAEEDEKDEEDEDVEARAIRDQTNKRAENDEGNEDGGDVEARAIRNETDKRAIQNEYRDAEPEPAFSRAGASRRNAE